MGTRGRTSAAALAVIGPNGIETVRRPDPPSDLTDEMADLWVSVVNRLPADWFPAETQPMLAQYCRHVIRARRLAQMIDATEKSSEFDVKEYRDLLRSEEEQSRAIASLATKMRISQQTTYDKSKKKGGSRSRPWDFTGQETA